MTHSICLVQSLPAKDALQGVYLRSAVCTRDAPSQDLSIYSSPNLFATYPGPVQSRLLTKWPSIRYFPGVREYPHLRPSLLLDQMYPSKGCTLGGTSLH